MLFEQIARRWPGATCVVAGAGPSLTWHQGEACRLAGIRGIAVNDAHRMLQWADVLYACDAAWWKEYDGALEFKGERWSSHSDTYAGDHKLALANRWGLSLVRGAAIRGFSFDPHRIHYGENSGFQAINLAILFGCTRILLIGFDMHAKGKRHFFGNHPATLRNADPKVFIKNFNMAATDLKQHPEVQIINCTPGTALDCFVKMPLEQALAYASA